MAPLMIPHFPAGDDVRLREGTLCLRDCPQRSPAPGWRRNRLSGPTLAESGLLVARLSAAPAGKRQAHHFRARILALAWVKNTGNSTSSINNTRLIFWLSSPGRQFPRMAETSKIHARCQASPCIQTIGPDTCTARHHCAFARFLSHTSGSVSLLQKQRNGNSH